MFDLLTAFAYLCILSFSIATIGLIAGACLKQEHPDTGQTFIRDQLLGLLVLVALYSLLMTGGSTVLLGLGIPFLLAFRKYLKWPTLTRIKNPGKEYLILLLSLTLLSFLCAIPEFLWMYDAGSGQLLQTPHFDYLYYARISGFMADTGIENRLMSMNVLFPEYRHIKTPYHYPEIWLNSLIHLLSGKSTIKTEMLVCYPYLRALTLGVLFVSLRERFKHLNLYLTGLLTLLLASVTAVYFSTYHQSSWLRFHDGLSQSGMLMSFGRKYLFMYAYLAYAVLILWRSGKYLPFLLILSAIPLFSIGTLPGILLSVTGIAGYLFFRKKISAKTLILSLSSCYASALFIAGFYLIQGDGDSNNTIQQSVLILKLLKEPGIGPLKQLFFAAFYPAARLLVMYFLWIVLIGTFTRKKPEAGILLIGILAVAGGNIAASMATGVLDNGQFFYNILPLFNLCLIAWALQAEEYRLRQGSRQLILLGCALLLAGYIHITDQKYYQGSIAPYNMLPSKIRQQNLQELKSIAGNKPITGLYTIEPEELKELSFLDSYYRNRHFYLQFLDNYRDALSLNAPYFMKKGDSLNPVDRYLLTQNELGVFLRKEGRSFNDSSLADFASKANVMFRAIGDSLELYPAHRRNAFGK